MPQLTNRSRAPAAEDQGVRPVDEAVRVLKPGGRLRIADFRSTNEYVGRLRQLGIAYASERGLGWRYWYGGPWTATKLVGAAKPRG
jgi:arsenite methyltransferase